MGAVYLSGQTILWVGNTVATGNSGLINPLPDEGLEMRSPYLRLSYTAQHARKRSPGDGWRGIAGVEGHVPISRGWFAAPAMVVTSQDTSAWDKVYASPRIGVGWGNRAMEFAGFYGFRDPVAFNRCQSAGGHVEYRIGRALLWTGVQRQWGPDGFGVD